MKYNKILGYTPVFKTGSKTDYIPLDISYKNKEYLRKKRKQLIRQHNCYDIYFTIKEVETI